MDLNQIIPKSKIYYFIKKTQFESYSKILNFYLFISSSDLTKIAATP